MAIQAPEGYGSGGEVCVFWCNEVRVAQLPSSANTNARYHVLRSRYTSLDDVVRNVIYISAPIKSYISVLVSKVQI